MTDGEAGETMMKHMQQTSVKQTSVKVRREFDETFKRESVQHWVQSGKSAQVIAHELGLQASRLYAWKQQGFAPAVAGGGSDSGGEARLAGGPARPVGRGPAREPALARAARHFKKTLGILSEPSLNATNGSTR